MAEDSWPKSTRNGGTINDYEHEQLVGTVDPSGLIGLLTDTPLVYADSTGMQIKVRANRYGLVRGKTWYSGPVEFTKPIGANTSGATRVDLVVLRWDRANNSVTLQVRAGVPGAGLPAPVQQVPPATTFGTGIWELPVAQVTVANNAATIAPANAVNLAWLLGPDGKILCTSATRPYGEIRRPGLEISEDGKYTYTWDGTYWVPEAGQLISAGYLAQNVGSLDNGDRLIWQATVPIPCPGQYDVNTQTPLDGADSEQARINLNINGGYMGGRVIRFAAFSFVEDFPLTAWYGSTDGNPLVIQVRGTRINGGNFYQSRSGNRFFSVRYLGRTEKTGNY